MKYILKEKSQVPVGSRLENSYRYENGEGDVVQFNAGAVAWTFEVGKATTTRKTTVTKLVHAFITAGMDAVKNSTDFESAISTLEI